MIYTSHIVIGAAIGAKAQSLGLIVILGLLSHLILDLIPHYDYSLKKIVAFVHKKKGGLHKGVFIDCLKVIIDILLGLTIVFFVLYKKDFFININYTHLWLIIAGIFFSTLPDLTQTFFHLFPSKIGKKYIKFHHTLHWHNKQKEGKITFFGLTTQIIVIVISVFLLSL
jgi:hypothetical protein